MKKIIILSAVALIAASCSNQQLLEPETLQPRPETQKPADSLALEQPQDSIPELLSLYQQDSLALDALYQSANGQNWPAHKTNWRKAPMHRWSGVQTEKINGQRRVVSLRLMGLNLKGSMAAELGNLTELRNLNLSHNSELTGSIPEQIYNLTKLEVLNLEYTSVIGQLSEQISKLQSLDSLALRKGYQGAQQTRLTGSIPQSICQMKNLRYLDLDNNAFTGVIPENIGQMESLEELKLWCNKLSGSIPESLGNLSKLQVFFGANNALTGEIPESLTNLSSILEISLDHNALTGSITEAIGRLATIEYLDLGHNLLTGELPKSIVNLKQLGIFRANDNALTGSLPEGICDQNPMLVALVLDNNNLTGELPELTGFLIPGVAQPWYCSISIKGNKLSGPIPAWLVQFPSDCRKNLIPQQPSHGFSNENLVTL